MHLLESLGKRISSLGGQLEHFLSGSEEVFLRAGSRLMELDTKSRGLLEESQRSVGAEESDFDADLARKLASGVRKLETHMEATKSASQEGVLVLRGVLDGITNVTKLRDGFKIILSTLRTLASSTQIENTRAGIRGGGFDTVAKDVRDLAVRLAPKFDEVAMQGQAVLFNASKALQAMQAFQFAHVGESARVRDDAQESIHALEMLSAKAKGIVGKSLGYMEECRRAIGCVQTSLQVHDIARQMIEHVGTGLHELVSDLSGALRRGDLTVEDWMAELDSTSRLEGAQLSGARARLVAGIKDIEKNLRIISKSVGALALDLGDLGGGHGGGSVLDKVEAGIQSMTQDLERRATIESTMMESLREVLSAVNTMEDRVDEVAGIGDEAKVIGLNAMVKASNAGRDGHTLNVLARALQDVAETIDTTSKDALSIMDAVGDDAHRLVSRSEGAGQTGAVEVDAMVSELSGVMVHLRAFQDGLHATLKSLTSGSSELQRDVEEIAQSLERMIERTTILQTLETELAGIARAAAAAAGSPSRKRMPVRESTHHRRYTMAAERATLSGVTSGGTAKETAESTEKGLGEGSVEFF